MQTRERVNAARAYVLTANTRIFSLSVHGVLSDEPPLIFQMIKGVLPVSVSGEMRLYTSDSAASWSV